MPKINIFVADEAGSKTDNAKIYSKWVENWRDINVIGVIISSFLLSLGAPFWYNALGKLFQLRSLLVRKDDAERIIRQTTQVLGKELLPDQQVTSSLSPSSVPNIGSNIRKSVASIEAKPAGSQDSKPLNKSNETNDNAILDQIYKKYILETMSSCYFSKISEIGICH